MGIHMASTSTVTHFISPQVIDIDVVDSKVEAITDFVPIAVHAAYMCDEHLELQLVNTTPLDDNPLYKIQDYAGNDLDVSQVAAVIAPLLGKMRHLSVTGTDVDDNDVSGALLTTINGSLSGLLFPTANEDVSGNFTLKKEVFKTLSSYLTNHTTLSLTSSITDLSGVALDQLSAAESIASELVRFGSLAQDASGDDTLSFLNAMLDNNNSNTVFGQAGAGLRTVVFIVKSTVTATSDSTDATGLNPDNLTAIAEITNRTAFSDEVGGDLTDQNYLGEDISSVDVNGEWY